MINYSYILVSLVLILDITLGIIVYIRDRKNIINYSFFWLTFWTMIWIASNFLENEPALKDHSNLFIKIDFASAFLLGYYFFVFCVNFPRKILFPLHGKIVLFFVPLVFCILSFSDFIIKDINFYDNTLNFSRGILYWVYAAILISYIVIGCLSLFLKFRTLKELEKIQTMYILSGFTLSASLALVINLILTQLIPISANVNRIGIYGIIFFIIFTTYAIIKHYLMNIKLIATELLVGLVSIVLFVDLLISNNSLPVVFLKLGILIVFIYLGISLVKGVLREIKQKEDVERAYEIEKSALEKEKEVHKEFERLDKAKNQFMLATQHHLRTPLTSMRGYLDLIFGGSYGKIPPKMLEILKRFEISTKNEVKLVNDFLDVSQFQLGKGVVFLREGVDLAPILKEAVEDVSLEAKDRGIYVKAEIPDNISKIKADEQKLKAAIYNIVDNAVKYTKQGGVTVSLKEVGNKVRVVVKDTGVGISKEDKDKLFGKLFERGEQAQKIFSTGRGIGLYITFKIVEGHNGKIWVESEGEGKGSSFFIELPIK